MGVPASPSGQSGLRPEPASRLGHTATVPNAALPSFAGNQHELLVSWDSHRCARCGWFMPDTQGRRGTAAIHGEMFPSRDAFEHYKRTGVRAWFGGSPCDASAIEARSAATGNTDAARKGESAPAKPDAQKTRQIPQPKTRR